MEKTKPNSSNHKYLRRVRTLSHISSRRRMHIIEEVDFWGKLMMLRDLLSYNFHIFLPSWENIQCARLQLPNLSRDIIHHLDSMHEIVVRLAGCHNQWLRIFSLSISAWFPFGGQHVTCVSPNRSAFACIYNCLSLAEFWLGFFLDLRFPSIPFLNFHPFWLSCKRFFQFKDSEATYFRSRFSRF